MKIKFIILFFLANSASLLFSQDQKLYAYKKHIVNNDTLQYRILFPKNFSEDKEYPVVLFLHGAGERGNNNTSQLAHGSKLFLSNKNRETFPAIVIFPQCPKNDFWSNVTVNRSKKGLRKFNYKKGGKPTKSMELVLDLMDSFVKKPFVNKNQVYVGGLSMGGMGTFDILKKRPKMFAAAFPICGGGNPKSVESYAKHVALWVFHGGKDDVVHPYFSLSMVAALQYHNANVKLSYYENDNHNSWDSAFAEPMLLTWLFSNIKSIN